MQEVKASRKDRSPRNLASVIAKGFLNAALVVVALAVIPTRTAANDSPSWSKVQQAPDRSFAPDLYTSKQLYVNVPYYLKHFPALANAVIEDGEDRGFIDLHVWRTPFARHNLRTMENHVAFSYFYTEKAPWNPYYNNPEVRKRLEAVLTYLSEHVGPDGQVSEYSPEDSNAAAISFGVNKLLLTLERLQKKDPDIDPDVFEAARKTARRMIMRLTKPSVFNKGDSYANQVDSLWFSASLYRRLFNDQNVAEAMRERFKSDFDMMQSPAGFFYEDSTTEWAYNLGTHKGVLNYVSTEVGWLPPWKKPFANGNDCSGDGWRTTSSPRLNRRAVFC